MALETNINLTQKQSLSLTPEMQQSIKVLQLSTFELLEYISQQVEQNPLLDYNDYEISIDKPKNDSAESNEFDITDVITGNVQALEKEGDSAVSNKEIWGVGDENSSAVYQRSDVSAHEKVSKSFSSDSKQYILENTVSVEKTLKEHLIEQINVDFTDQEQLIIALNLVDFLDESGYVAEDYLSLAKTLKCKTYKINIVLKKLQNCDPVGVFARSLSECLQLQLQEQQDIDYACETLFANLNLLAKKDFTKLKRLCKISQEELMELIEKITALNPRPASDFSSEVVKVIQPDVFLYYNESDDIVLELNPANTSNLLLDKAYYAVINEKSQKKEEKEYIKGQMQNASHLIKSLDQRANTILKVASAIAKYQEDFFRKGIYYLKPMKLNDIASETELHESTISRAVNKYIATPNGTYEMKYFFSTNVSDDSMSNKTVKMMIKKLIDDENSEHIFSDTEISKILADEDVQIARRTVTKYRESLNIPPMAQRKIDKKEG